MPTPSTGRRLLRGLGVVVIGAVGVLALAGPAAAQACYPPGPNCVVTTVSQPLTGSVSVSDNTVVPGQVIDVRVGGFRPGSLVTITLGSSGQVLGTGTADAQGRATITVTIPLDVKLGRNDIIATGTGVDGQPLVLSERITVVAPAAAAANARNQGAVFTNETAASTGRRSSGVLAKTGASFVVPAVAAGLALVGTGVLLRRSVKRRRPVAA